MRSVIGVCCTVGVVALLLGAGCGLGEAGPEDVEQANQDTSSEINRLYEQICDCEYDEGSSEYNMCLDSLGHGTTEMSACEREAAECHADSYVDYAGCVSDAISDYRECLSGCVDEDSSAGEECEDELDEASHDCEQLQTYELEEDMETCEVEGSLDECS